MNQFLQIKHLAAYLPYGLPITNGYRDDLIMFGIKSHSIYSYFFVNGAEKSTVSNFLESYPFLKPLSDLKDVVSPEMSEINTDTLIAIEISEFANKKISLHNLSYAAYEELLRNHYDVFGLLEKNIAIDYSKRCVQSNS